MNRATTYPTTPSASITWYHTASSFSIGPATISNSSPLSKTRIGAVEKSGSGRKLRSSVITTTMVPGGYRSTIAGSLRVGDTVGVGGGGGDGVSVTEVGNR